jgi:hypothetical protein
MVVETLADRLEQAVEHATRRQREIEFNEKLIKDQKKELAELTDITIPAIMAEMGMSSGTTPSGISVELAQIVYANISEARSAEAYSWLEANGHGGMIKTVTKTSVHPSTLRAWAREMLENGEDVPLELFGIYQAKTTKIKLPKE